MTTKWLTRHSLALILSHRERWDFTDVYTAYETSSSTCEIYLYVYNQTENNNTPPTRKLEAIQYQLEEFLHTHTHFLSSNHSNRAIFEEDQMNKNINNLDTMLIQSRITNQHHFLDSNFSTNHIWKCGSKYDSKQVYKSKNSNFHVLIFQNNHLIELHFKSKRVK